MFRAIFSRFRRATHSAGPHRRTATGHADGATPTHWTAGTRRLFLFGALSNFPTINHSISNFQTTRAAMARRRLVALLRIDTEPK